MGDSPHRQFGIGYHGEQQPQREQMQFGGGVIVATFRRELQRREQSNTTSEICATAEPPNWRRDNTSRCIERSDLDQRSRLGFRFPESVVEELPVP
jgi:hypothetical protein